MARLGKTEWMHVRLTANQRRQVGRAARLVSRRRGAIVAPSTLFREVGMKGVEALLAELEPTQALSA